RGDILRQQLGEAVLLAFIALVIALGTQAVLMPVVLALLVLPGEFPLHAGDFILLGALAVSVGLLNALYPAVVLASTLPGRVLKANAEIGQAGSLRARTLLVGAQFSLALMFMTAAAVLYAQLAVSGRQPLGFNPENLLFSSHGSVSTGASEAAL